MFTPKRNHILESMQVTIAYIFRKKRTHRIHMERLAEMRRKEQEEQAKQKAAKERRMK